MEEKKAESALRKFWRFFEKWDELLLAGMLIPFIKNILEKFSAKAGERVEQKIEKIVLGEDTASADKSIEDEILFRRAINKFDRKSEIESFRSELRAIDIEKAKAFTLYVAKMLKATAKEEKKTKKSDWKKQGKKDVASATSTTTNTHYDFTDTNEFFASLLERADFVARVKFLEDENVFSLIRKKGVSFVDKVGDFFANGELSKLIKSAAHEVSDIADQLDKPAGKMARTIERNIYAYDEVTDSRGRTSRRIRKDAEGSEILRENLQYRGFLHAAFPVKSMTTWASIIFFVLVIGIMIFGIKNW